MASTSTKLPKPLKCDCTADKHGNKQGAEHQDEVYGKGNRLHNHSEKGYRCTVCGKVKAG
jgi:hypothetical protein